MLHLLHALIAISFFSPALADDPPPTVIRKHYRPVHGSMTNQHSILRSSRPRARLRMVLQPDGNGGYNIVHESVDHESVEPLIPQRTHTYRTISTQVVGNKKHTINVKMKLRQPASQHKLIALHQNHVADKYPGLPLPRPDQIVIIDPNLPPPETNKPIPPSHFIHPAPRSSVNIAASSFAASDSPEGRSFRVTPPARQLPLKIELAKQKPLVNPFEERDARQKLYQQQPGSPQIAPQDGEADDNDANNGEADDYDADTDEDDEDEEDDEE